MVSAELQTHTDVWQICTCAALCPVVLTADRPCQHLRSSWQLRLIAGLKAQLSGPPTAAVGNILQILVLLNVLCINAGPAELCG